MAASLRLGVDVPAHSLSSCGTGRGKERRIVPGSSGGPGLDVRFPVKWTGPSVGSSVNRDYRGQFPGTPCSVDPMQD